MIPSGALRLTLLAACVTLAGASVAAQIAPASGPAAETSAGTLPAAVAATAPAAPTEAPDAGESFGASAARRSGSALPAEYDLLTRKSIFSRDRSPRRERPAGGGYRRPSSANGPYPSSSESSAKMTAASPFSKTPTPAG